jgi:hypothetical protein
MATGREFLHLRRKALNILPFATSFLPVRDRILSGGSHQSKLSFHDENLENNLSAAV